MPIERRQNENEHEPDLNTDKHEHAAQGTPASSVETPRFSPGLLRRHDGFFSGDPDEYDAMVDEVLPEEEVEPSSLGPGHDIMDRSAITAALARSGYDGSFENLSSAEEQRVRLLLHYRAEAQFRPHVIASPPMIARLEALGVSAPNFAVVTLMLVRAAHVSLLAKTPIRPPPILVVGEPGVGKSRYARAVAAALGTPCEVINGSTLPDVGSLTGYPPVWRGAGAGRVAKAIVASPTSGPLLFVDECDKIVDYEESAFPLDRLLTLLEPHTAAAFQDEHLQVPMRADRVLWLFAANSMTTLSAPFLDRVVTVAVPSLSGAQRDAVLAAMLAEIAEGLGLSIGLAGPDALNPLRELGPRRGRLALEIAVANSIAQGRRLITIEDVGDAVTLLVGARARTSVGFFPPRDPLPG